MAVKFWQAMHFTGAERLIELTEAIEKQTPFHGVQLGDHWFTPAKLDSPYPYPLEESGTPWPLQTPWPDLGASFGAMAAVTRRLHFSTTVLILPLHNPIQLARTFATLSAISGNRVSLGAGSGWMENEFRLAGVDFKTRGKRVDEMIDVMRLLWEGRMVEHKGRFFDFDRLELGPKPPGKIPIYMAGASETAMRRAAAKCDGWITGDITKEGIWESVVRIRKMVEEAGRSNDDFRVICNIVADREIVQGLVDRGVTDVINASSAAEIKGGMTNQQKIDWYKWYADNIIAKVT
jgi:probable F420-dependent oxidoreductase